MIGVWWVVVVCGVWWGGVVGDRPQLVDSSVWLLPNASLLNIPLDVALVQLEFDQPLYTNGHTFLCPESHESCPDLTCKACDWSGQEPTGCDDPDCCGPAQHGDMDAANAWCEEDREYKTLKLGEISERFTLGQDEEMFVRFFVPEEYYCRPIYIIPRPYFGVPSSTFSTLTPEPPFSSLTTWKNLATHPQFGFGQTAVLICPNTELHPEYSVGTYAGKFYGITDTEFEVEIAVSPETYPLSQADDRISCDDVPSSVMDYASTHDPAFCVEDGTTHTIDNDDLNLVDGEVAFAQVSFVLPIPRGYHQISFGVAASIPARDSSFHLYCLASENEKQRGLQNAAQVRFGSSGQGFVFSGWFEEDVTYMFCSIRIFTELVTIRFTFSTVAPILRKNLIDLPDASISYMDALQGAWGITFGEPKYPCFDFYALCFDWVTTPSDDTLYLFPPPASPAFDTEQVLEDIQEFYRDAGLQEKKENRLSLTLLFQYGSLAVFEKNLTSLSIAITSITNKDGELVDLPGGGVDTNTESVEYSISNYVEHIPLDEIPEFEFPPCDTRKYRTYQQIVFDRLEEVGSQNTLDEVLSLKYSLDVMNEGLLAQSCTQEVAANLDIIESEVILPDSTRCFSLFNTLQFWGDVCCNALKTLTDCCIPRDINATIFPYLSTADVSDCGEPECAQTYYEDLSFSLNHLEDASLGCTSGIQNPSSSLDTAIYNAMETQYISCLNDVGFGGSYEGIFCQVDEDCDGENLGHCYEGTCVMRPLEEVEDLFLECYIAAMPASLEYYIKRNVLPKSAASSNKDSLEFFEALKKAATVQDCVNPTNPLVIEHRTRYAYRPTDYACISAVFGYSWPDEADEVVEFCPGAYCLRSFGCLFNVSSCINACGDGHQVYLEATEELCPIEELCDVDLDDDCDGSYCVYCPSNGDLPCTEVPSYTNEDDCEQAYACELPDGTVDFTLSEEECRNQGEGCTTDCPGESCESIYLYSGGCFIPSINSSTDCSTYASTNSITTEWYNGSLCVLPEITSESDCDAAPTDFGDTEWETCQQFDLDDCDSETLEKRYLGCYVSLWHECQNEDECESEGGMCTDRLDMVIVHSYDPVDVQYGACFTSGEYIAETKPSCGNPFVFKDNRLACRAFPVRTGDGCVGVVSSLFFVESNWLDPALTKSDCLDVESGRGGCQLYQDPHDVLLWIHDEDKCICRGGVLEPAFEWIPPIWRGGVPRKLEWTQAQNRQAFEFKDALSFILLSAWIAESTEEQSIYPFQSQIICESQSITSPVFILVCDCLADGGEICYDVGELQKEIQMGLSEVCEGETTFVKTPSAQVQFGTKSVSNGCSFLEIAIIYMNWFAAPFVPPPLSFKWEDPSDGGVVLNDDGATVGELLGDGMVLTFTTPSIIRSFDVCLRLSTEGGEYKVPDFGYTTEELKAIYPVGLDTVEEDDRGDEGGVWYCSSFDFQKAPTAEEGVIRLFPIDRLENYEEEEDEYVSDTTTALCYTLGALFCFVGVCCIFGLVAFFSQTGFSQKNLKNLSLPLFCTATFLIVSVFRASFMFLYPIGTFEFEPLQYFIIFEIPTFLFFSVLIFMIYTFKRLVYKKGFFPGNPTPILVIGWTLVWSLWVIVTIVYSEVILEDSSGTSPCEGRVEKSYTDEEDNTRKLAIAYQSVIIFITFMLTAIFFYYTYLMYSASKRRKSQIKQFVIVVGGTFNVAFLLRTVLFLIILVLDFSSAVYLFCTLFFTEILVMVFLLIQFNFRYFKALVSSVTTSSWKSSSNSQSNSATHSMYEM